MVYRPWLASCPMSILGRPGCPYCIAMLPVVCGPRCIAGCNWTQRILVLELSLQDWHARRSSEVRYIQIQLLARKLACASMCRLVSPSEHVRLRSASRR